MRWRGWLIGGFVVLLGIGAAAWYWREPLQTQVTSITASVTGEPAVRFAVIGDTHGVNPIYQEAVRRMRSEDFSFLLHLADTSEDGTEAEFQAVKELERSLPFPVYHTVGNHDIASDDTRAVFAEVFEQSAWGSWQIGEIRLIILDNANRRVGFSDQQLDWLETELAQPFDGVTFLAYHRPFGLPLESFFGDDETPASRLTNQRLVHILTDHPVDMIFSGHVHTHLTYSLADIPAVVSGGGGDPAQALLGGPKNNYFHYLEVEVRGSKVTPTVRRLELTE